MSPYPPWLKTLMKAAPVCVVFLGFGTAFPTVLYNVLFHAHERIEKFHFRSCKFDRVTRKRDEKLRQYYKQAIEWDPNNERLSKHRPLLRY